MVRTAVMRAGQFAETGPADEILRQPKNPYTREHLSAVPELPRRRRCPVWPYKRSPCRVSQNSHPDLVSDLHLGYNLAAEIFSRSSAYS